MEGETLSALLDGELHGPELDEILRKLERPFDCSPCLLLAIGHRWHVVIWS